MFKITRKSRLVKVAAATAAIGSIAAIGLVGNSPAQADPKQYTDPIFGFGSDTLQDVTNAFAGANIQGTYLPPLQTSAATGQKQIVSWDAFPPGTANPTAASCITTKVGSPTILRPNGSSNGVRALSSANSAGLRWPFSGTPCGAARSMGGIIDFARSSSTPTTTSGPLVYIPFGRDYLPFAYVRPLGNPVTSLSPGELQTLHSVGPQLIDADGTGPGTVVVPVFACGIQTGSGTYSSWMTSLGRPTDGTGDSGTSICNGAGTGASFDRIQENNGPDLTAKAGLLASITNDICDGTAGPPATTCENAQVIVGFSASQFIARSNGLGSPAPNLGPNGGLGAINGVISVTGEAPNLVANSLAYFTSPFGRDVSFVLAADAVIPSAISDPIPHMVDMFVGTSSKVCQATATIERYGFLRLPLTGCGATSVRGNFRTS